MNWLLGVLGVSSQMKLMIRRERFASAYDLIYIILTQIRNIFTY